MSDKDIKTAPDADLETQISAQISSGCFEGIEISIPDSTQELQDQTIEAENQLSRDAVKQGFRFLVLKQKLPHGDFESWIESHGFKSRTVRERMQAANFLLKAPENLRPQLSGLGHKKLIACASADEQVLAAAEKDPEFINQLASTSYVEMRERVRSMDNQIINLQAQNETLDTENDRLKALLKKERAGSEYPDFVVVTRHESDALSQKALLCMDDMSRLMDDLIKLQNDEHMSGEFENYLNMSSTTMLIHLNGMQAKLSQILHNAMVNLPPQLTSQQVNANMLYSDEEIGHAISEREMLMREHEQEKQIRANEREANKKRGPGRPKGSK